uniref:Uridine kinase n=1 Tax=Cyanothece sp. (strain PCC 7425 / ATCC 29141) TaxID=395961 RepID=B8HJZ3_CYAP4
MTELNQLITKVLHNRFELQPDRSLLVAISGIDGSGKGYITEKLVAQLNQQDVHAIALNIDPWLTPPEQRFNPHHPAEHFYHHAFAFEQIFQQLIDPLRTNRSIYLETTLTGQFGIPFTQIYDFQDVDIIVLEGIFLLKRSLRQNYDLAFWIECSFETALARALQRNQENLPADQIIQDYEQIYFPAQRFHLAIDDPRSTVDGIYLNDSD